MAGTRRPAAAGGELPTGEPASRADLWEAVADERERLADEREALADEREALADEREELADRYEHALDRREAELTDHGAEGDPRDAGTGGTGPHDGGTVDLAVERAWARDALRRAEAALRRSEAEVLRARQSAARVDARAALQAAARERQAATGAAAPITDPRELAWMAERRDFVATERDSTADERDRAADQRDAQADRRECEADARDRDARDRDRRLTGGTRPAPAADSPTRDSPTGDSPTGDSPTGDSPTGDSPTGDSPTGDSPTRDTPAGDLRGQRRGRDGRRREAAAANRRASARQRLRAAAAWGPQAYGPMLMASFAELARRLLASENLGEVLTRTVRFTVDCLPGCDRASVTLWRDGRVLDRVASDAVAAELDEIQFRTGTGPAAEVLAGADRVPAADLGRWPVFGSAATRLGVAGAASFELSLPGTAWTLLGTLTLYGARPDAFGADDLEFGSVLAAYVSAAIGAAHRREELDRRESALHRGLSSRDVIGQAKGILMERRRLSAGDAFDVLRRVSQRLNRKLIDVAQHLADTGQLPE